VPFSSIVESFTRSRRRSVSFLERMYSFGIVFFSVFQAISFAIRYVGAQ